MAKNFIELQIIYYAIFTIGAVLYTLDVIKTGLPLTSWKGKAGIALILISFCLIVIPVVLNPDLCSVCEKVIEDTWGFCPYCGTEIGK